MANRRDKIIEASIDLFNEKGCLNSSTRHIADKLGISVGNLYYYFKNKEEIIITIYQKFMSSLGSHFTFVEKDIDIVFDFSNFLISQMEYEYQYRFLRLEMINLISKYPKIRKASEIGIGLKVKQMELLNKHQIKYGYMKELNEGELKFFISNILIIGSQWELFWILNRCEDEAQRRRNGVLNLLYFLKLNLTKKGLIESNILDSIAYLENGGDNGNK